MPYGSTSARSYPVSLVFTGYYRWDNGATQGQGTQGIGYWWSSTALQNLINQAGNAGVGIDTIGSYFGLYKIYSFSLRCIGITPYGSTSARSYPVSLVFSGNYYWNLGQHYIQETGANIQSNKLNSDIYSYNLYISTKIMDTADYASKTGGFSLRYNPFRLRLHFRA